MKFLDVRTEIELNMLAEKSPVMKKAAIRLKELSADEKARMLYEAREKERRDNASREHGAIKQAQLEIAKNLLKRNRPIDEIAEDIGFSFKQTQTSYHGNLILQFSKDNGCKNAIHRSSTKESVLCVSSLSG